MKRVLFSILLLLLSFPSFAENLEAEDECGSVLSKNNLPAWAVTSSFDVVLREVEIADRRADDLFLACKTSDELQIYCKNLRKSMLDALGEFPGSKCPLNAKTVSTVFKDGYKVEKILFESWPGIYVTANLFLPDSSCFKPPYPAVLQPCGHTTQSKGSANYQRLCVLATKSGIAVLIYDTINAGERKQGPDDVKDSWNGHNRIGALADLIGQSFGGYRVWDAIRALDYLDIRTDLRHNGYGCFGNSGGGNITAFLTAIDDRIAVSAPNGYITTFSDAARDASIGPGDAEQNIFGQLSLGINHLAFCLMRSPVPLLIGSTSGDQVFPFCGTVRTYSNLYHIYSKMGWGGRTAHVWGQGLHGYRESTRTAAAAWMRRWLLQDSLAWNCDVRFYQAFDDGFDLSDSSIDAGLTDGAEYVTQDGDASKLPGYRTYYDLLRQQLGCLLQKRGTAKVDPETVSKTAHIRIGAETGFLLYDAFEIKKYSGFTAERGTFKFANGLVLPSVLLTGSEVSGNPLIVVSNERMSMNSGEIFEAVKAGRPVLALDLFGCGEISKLRRTHYSMPQPEEEVSVLLRALGRTCVGEQAEELIIAADFMNKRFGHTVEIRAHHNTCVAAAHAHAVKPDIIKRVTKIDPPVSWTKAIEENLRIPFAITVPGALKFYDWTDL